MFHKILRHKKNSTNLKQQKKHNFNSLIIKIASEKSNKKINIISKWMNK